MSYQVLARKWRPKSFQQLIGQPHVVQALVNGLEQGRLHHAFLFTGTRGVGKTTIARILAKCLNCEQGVSASPCGECSSCLDIDAGRFVDMLEIDAASRTKVDDTRDLLDNVQYMPNRGRFKVYIIDEVHMLSTASFNALLKTLEEPPEHVKFVLATTDPQKIPVTILSRCLQFSLMRLLPEQISGYLTEIAGHEEFEAEAAALDEVARAADGSMRDALSLLDQALAFGGGAVREDDVRAMLGSLRGQEVGELLEHLQAGNAQAVLDAVAKLAAQSVNFDRLLAQLAETLHRMALVQQVPDFEDSARPDWPAIRDIAGRLSPEDTQLFYEIAIRGRQDLSLAPDPRSGAEMTLLRMLAFRPAESDAAGEAPAGQAGGGKRAGAPASSASGKTAAGKAAQAATSSPAANAKRGQAVASQAAPAEPELASPPATSAPSRQEEAPVTPPPAELQTQPAAAAPTLSIDQVTSHWDQVIQQLEVRGPVRELARNIRFNRCEDQTWHFQIPQQYMHLGGGKSTGQLARALGHLTGSKVRLELHPGSDDLCTPASVEARDQQRILSEAESAIEQDPTIQSLKQRLGARILEDSIKPIQ